VLATALPTIRGQVVEPAAQAPGEVAHFRARNMMRAAEVRARDRIGCSAAS
jgi:hypothetical protein